jgi:NitT/TauT family transport system substrate-binding protein
MNNAQEKQILTVQDLKEFLNISEATIYKWKRERGLPYIKIGRTLRFDKNNIIKWLEQYETVTECASS